MSEQTYEFSQAVIALLKGVVSEVADTRIWNTILDEQVYIEDYISKIGLTLVIQKGDGYAYLKQAEFDSDDQALPRLISKRQLKYLTSLILVILRKELVELDRTADSGRYVITKAAILEKVRPYLKDTTDEAKQKKEVDTEINAVEKMGFLRLIKNTKDEYEIIPILRGFVDAQWLEEFDQKLRGYRQYVKGMEEDE